MQANVYHWFNVILIRLKTQPYAIEFYTTVNVVKSFPVGFYMMGISLKVDVFLQNSK